MDSLDHSKKQRFGISPSMGFVLMAMMCLILGSLGIWLTIQFTNFGSALGHLDCSDHCVSSVLYDDQSYEYDNINTLLIGIPVTIIIVGYFLWRAWRPGAPYPLFTAKSIIWRSGVGLAAGAVTALVIWVNAMGDSYRNQVPNSPSDPPVVNSTVYLNIGLGALAVMLVVVWVTSPSSRFRRYLAKMSKPPAAPVPAGSRIMPNPVAKAGVLPADPPDTHPGANI